MATFNELADGRNHDVTLAEPHDARAELRDAGASHVDGSETELAAEARDPCPDDLLLPAVPARPNGGFRRTSRALVKPLIAMATTQYIIVTALVGFAAITVAQQTTHIINEKFAAITLALKRF